MKKIVAFTVVLLVAGVWVPLALALDTLGPPAAGLNLGQWGLGFDYSHSRTDIKLYNAERKNSFGGFEKFESWKIKHFTTDVVTANIGYGFTNELEVFLRLGAIRNEDTKGTVIDSPAKYEGDTGFDYGFGAKATLWQQDNLKLGGIAQFSWAKPGGKTKVNWGGETGVWSYSTDIKVITAQIAVGPTYKLADDVSIYGGPFIQYIDGNISLKGSDPTNPTYSEKYSADIRQQNYFGGFIGMQLEFTKDAPFNIEWQHTATDDAFAMNLIWKY